MKEFNVIIPSAYKDFAFLPRVVKFVKEYIRPKEIVIIINIRLSKFLPPSIRNDRNVIVVDENTVVDNLNFEYVKSCLSRHGSPTFRTGWFLQQFLKLGFATSKYCNTEYYLSWDADTLPLRSIKFFDESEHPFVTMKKEHNEAYFVALKRLLKLDKYANFSYIAEHMMFQKSAMLSMLKEISKCNISGDNWIEKIVNATEPKEVNSFSEFETYGNYCLNRYPGMYAIRQLNTFRKAGYINGRFISDRKLGFMGFDLDTASFELGDYGCGLNKPATYLYAKWIKFKEKIIKKLI